MIKLNVLVLDAQNSPTMDLKKEEFRVLDDGVAQAISYFSTDELPLDYCIVADTSGSLKESAKQLIDAAQTIVRNNKPGDETSLIEFKDQPALLEEFTSRKDRIAGSLEALRGAASSQSAVIDAVYLATQYVQEYKPADQLSRRALIVITDGDDNSSYYKLDDLKKLLSKTSIQALVIGYDIDAVAKRSGKNAKRAIDLLTQIAKETGGQAYFPKSNTELEEVANRVLQTLRRQYVIGYRRAGQSKAASYHSVSVSVLDDPSRDKRTAITRPGYVDAK
jgi:Ca-activated chloride channel family protein